MGEPPLGVSWREQVPALALAALGVGVAARLVLLAIPPFFVTDVWYYDVQAAAHLLAGVDPYGAAYSVPAQLATPGAERVFAYLPGVFAFLVPGDFSGARLGLVACDLVIAASLALFGRRAGSYLAALFLLLPPTLLFSTAFLNDSLPAVAFLSVAVLLERRGQPVPGGAAMGLALASSQEAWLVFPVYLAYCARNRRLVPPLASMAVAAAVVAPFFLWNPSAFIADTIYFQFQRAAVPLLSSGPFGVNVNLSLQGVLAAAGTTAPLALRAGLALVTLGVLVWRSSRSLTYLLWGGAASAWICLFMLAGEFYWSYLELPFVLSLFWAAPRLESRMGLSTLKEAPATVGADPR